MAMRPILNRAGLGSTTGIDEPPPRLFSYESPEDEESGGKEDEGLGGPTFPEAAGVLGPIGGAAGGGSAGLGTTNNVGSAGGQPEDNDRILEDSDFDVAGIDFLDAPQEVRSMGLDEECSSDREDEVKAIFHQLEIAGTVMEGIADVLNIPEDQAVYLYSFEITWPSSIDSVLEGVKEGGEARRQKELRVVRDSHKDFYFGREAVDQLR